MIESRSLVTWGCGKAGWGRMVGGYEWAQRNFYGIGYAHFLIVLMVSWEYACFGALSNCVL